MNALLCLTQNWETNHDVSHYQQQLTPHFCFYTLLVSLTIWRAIISVLFDTVHFGSCGRLGLSSNQLRSFILLWCRCSSKWQCFPSHSRIVELLTLWRLLTFLLLSAEFMIVAAELEVFPYDRTIETHNGKRKELYIFHVYGAPLTWLNLCLKSVGRKKWCSGRKKAMKNFTTSVLKTESVEAMLSWTHGHVERGNFFGKVIWSISLDESQDLLKSLPNVSCQIKIYDSFTRDRKDFVMRLHDVLSANKEDYHLPSESTFLCVWINHCTTCDVISMLPSGHELVGQWISPHLEFQYFTRTNPEPGGNTFDLGISRGSIQSQGGARVPMPSWQRPCFLLFPNSSYRISTP